MGELLQYRRKRQILKLGFKTGGSFIACSPNFKIYI